MKRKILFLAMTVAIAAPIAGISLSQLRASPRPLTGCFQHCLTDDDCDNIIGGKCPVCVGNPPPIGGQCEDVH